MSSTMNCTILSTSAEKSSHTHQDEHNGLLSGEAQLALIHEDWLGNCHKSSEEPIAVRSSGINSIEIAVQSILCLAMNANGLVL